MKHLPDGKAQLRFIDLTDRVHLVETPTNLADREMIGIAIDRGQGSFEFEDENAATIPNRFFNERIQ